VWIPQTVLGAVVIALIFEITNGLPTRATPSPTPVRCRQEPGEGAELRLDLARFSIPGKPEAWVSPVTVAGSLSPTITGGTRAMTRPIVAKGTPPHGTSLPNRGLPHPLLRGWMEASLLAASPHLGPRPGPIRSRRNARTA